MVAMLIIEKCVIMKVDEVPYFSANKLPVN